MILAASGSLTSLTPNPTSLAPDPAAAAPPRWPRCAGGSSRAAAPSAATAAAAARPAPPAARASCTPLDWLVRCPHCCPTGAAVLGGGCGPDVWRGQDELVQGAPAFSSSRQAAAATARRHSVGSGVAAAGAKCAAASLVAAGCSRAEQGSKGRVRRRLARAAGCTCACAAVEAPCALVAGGQLLAPQLTSASPRPPLPCRARQQRRIRASTEGWASPIPTCHLATALLLPPPCCRSLLSPPLLPPLTPSHCPYCCHDDGSAVN